MKTRVGLRCLLIFGCLACLYASERDLLIGRAAGGRAYFDAVGRPRIVAVGQENRDFLEIEAEDPACSRVIRGGRPDRQVTSLRIKKNRLQQTWIVWQETTTAGTGHIFFGRLNEDGISDVHDMAAEYKGRPHAPDLEISVGGRLFTSWIQTQDGESRLVLKSHFPERSWIVRTAAEDSLFTPRLLADGEGGIWIFWVEATGGLDEILAARLEGDVLVPPVSLTPGKRVPHFHPSAGRDAQGRPLVAWTSYDGEDYQIYIRSHDGKRWLTPRQLTHVRGTANVKPVLTLFQGSIPVIVWLRDRGGIRDVVMSFRESEEKWSLPTAVSAEAPGLADPAVIAEGDRMIVSWESHEGQHLKTLTLSKLQMKTPAVSRKPAAVVSPGFRADEAFIAFGDSITYGILVPPWDIRELGYPPRLQALLTTLYQNPEVINRGVPADDTWGGVSRIADVITDDLALYLLLMLGTNDVSSESHSMITSAFNLSEMVAKCLKHGVFPLLATIIPRKGDRWTDFTSSRTLNLNNRIRRISREQNALLVDMYEAFINYPDEQGGWESLIGDAPDMLHPSLKGYQFMAETWHAHITRIPFPPSSAEARRMSRTGSVVLSWKPDQKTTADTEWISTRILRLRKTETDFSEIGVVTSSQDHFVDESPDLSQDPIYALKAVNASGLEGPASHPLVPFQGDPHPPSNMAVRIEANRAFLQTEFINVISWAENPANTGVFNIVSL
jgi:lysophospholipase L1-like esterase